MLAVDSRIKSKAASQPRRGDIQIGIKYKKMFGFIWNVTTQGRNVCVN